MTHFHIITLFPESIEGYFNTSMLKRAQRDKKIKVSYYNPRDFTKDKHKRIDQKPYGGGPGMVLEAESVLKAARKAIGRKDLKDVEVIFFSPSGKQFEQKDAVRLAKKKKHIVFLCGHYEGIDARAVKILKAKSVSVGPFVLTGGELPATLVADAVTRNIEGVLGNAESLEDTRVASPEVYTRPEILKWKGKNHKVPKVLLSGHHAKIEEWKKGKKK
ncbi:MAG: tRNA (guanosine(37)-N1)-methyltransferase TrmD [Parcubacteria group bacterium]|nr:tRNA (guanosine(37)-N1)-methyltransferase TrmD [Parcubacteria group bacterium]